MITIHDILSDPALFALDHPLIEQAIEAERIKRRKLRAEQCCETASETVTVIHKQAATCQSWSNLITPKQLVAVRSVASAKGINWETVSNGMFGIEPERLTKRHASLLIAELKRRERVR